MFIFNLKCTNDLKKISWLIFLLKNSKKEREREIEFYVHVPVQFRSF